MTIDVADISAIPFYNDDVRAAGEPAAVAALKAQVRAADALNGVHGRGAKRHRR